MEANTPTPSAKRERSSSPRAYSASGGLTPRSPPKPERSGVRPERALEANTLTPSRKARKIILPRAYSASGGLIPRSPAHQTAAERCRAGASLGGEQPNHTPKARKLLLPRAYSASGGLMPRSPAHQKPQRSGVGPERALEANTPTPSRKARKLLLPRAYSASGGLMPRSRNSADPKPRPLSLPADSSARLGPFLRRFRHYSLPARMNPYATIVRDYARSFREGRSFPLGGLIPTTWPLLVRERRRP